MATSQYKIGENEFQFWSGSPPGTRRQHGRTFMKPGVDGVGLQQIGLYGDPFQATLTAWFDGTNADAYTAEDIYSGLLYAGTQVITYNGVDYKSQYNHEYHVIGYRTAGIRKVPLLRRASTNAPEQILYSPGYIHVSEWTFLPEFVPPPPP